jgi:hypothetical protein
MISPFEHRVKHCIELYPAFAHGSSRSSTPQRGISNLAALAPAFDPQWQVCGMLLAEDGRELLASDSSVKIGKKECVSWRCLNVTKQCAVFGGPKQNGKA